MATSYEEVYESFLSNIKDKKILYPLEGESEQQYQDRLATYLLSTFKKAVPKFIGAKTNLSRNDTIEMFINDLRPLEIEIIGLLMLKEYYRDQLNFLASLNLSFSDKDWKSHEKSNQMNQYRQMLKEITDEIRVLVVQNGAYDNNGTYLGWYDS
jgi:hypothetical protein